MKLLQQLVNTVRSRLSARQMLGTLTLVLLLSACGNEPPKESALYEIERNGVLRVGMLMNASTYRIEGEHPTGFEYDLVKGFADELNVELEVVDEVHIEHLFQRLADGEVDFLAAGLDITSERQKLMRFSPPYHTVEQKLIFKQGARDRPRDWSQVDGEILVVAGSSHEEYLKQVSVEHPNLRWRTTRLYDANELLERVIEEEVAYTIADSNTLDVMRRYHPDLSIAFTVRDEAPLAWAFPHSQDDSLYSAIIDYIGRQHYSGEIIKLVDRYFGHVKQFNYVDTQLFIQAVEQTLPEYIELFQQYAGDIDWKLLAAISYQESHWNPWARSPTGVRGMMMLTLPTARSMGVRSRLDAEQSIRGGARYLARLRQRLPARITEPDRTWFALAAYNVGLGHLNDARELTRRQGGDPDYWVDVRARLPLLRQKQYYKTTRFGYARGNEPVTYVGNIRRYYDTLQWLDENGRIPYPANADLVATSDNEAAGDTDDNASEP